MIPEQMALFLVGLIAPFLANFLKGNALSGKPALWLVAVLSVVLAIVASFVAGTLVWEPEVLVRNGAVVFSMATVLYRQFLKEVPELE